MGSAFDGEIAMSPTTTPDSAIEQCASELEAHRKRVLRDNPHLGGSWYFGTPETIAQSRVETAEDISRFRHELLHPKKGA
jgi:hypothetical protein